MEIIGLILMIVGGVAALCGSVMMLIRMFQTSILWGLGGIFVPFVSLIWLIMHWDKGGRPFLIYLAGGLVCGAGVAMSGGMH